MQRFVYVDTETTDVKPGQIAQLAYIIADEAGQVETTANFYFSVGLMSPGAEAIHHLSPAVLAALSRGLNFEDCIDEMWDAWFSEATFVAHNAKFDLRFVVEELRRCGFPYQPPRTICTMQRMTPVCRLKGPYGLKWPKVEEVLRYIGAASEGVLVKAGELFEKDMALEPVYPPLGFHDARFDVTAVYLIHRWMMERGMV